MIGVRIKKCCSSPRSVPQCEHVLGARWSRIIHRLQQRLACNFTAYTPPCSLLYPSTAACAYVQMILLFLFVVFRLYAPGVFRYPTTIFWLYLSSSECASYGAGSAFVVYSTKEQARSAIQNLSGRKFHKSPLVAKLSKCSSTVSFFVCIKSGKIHMFLKNSVQVWRGL